MTDDIAEMFVMVARPKGKEASAIQLSRDIWKVEEELDLLYSSSKNAYVSYTEPGESGIVLKTDGTLFVSYSSEETCKAKFEEMKNKISQAKTLPRMVYGDLKLESYRISKKIQGKLQEVVPKGLLDFLKRTRQRQYDPEKVSFEFAEKRNRKNFLRITFDRTISGKKLLLDVTVESNEVEYGKETIAKVEDIIKK